MNQDASSVWKKKGVGLNPISQTHYIDHLAPICVIMQIPLLFLDDNDFELGKTYYPGLTALREDFDAFSPEYLISHYDVSFMSDLWDRDVMKAKFGDLEKKYQKQWRNVHVPHGFSDKGFYLAKSAREDIVLLYGDNMIDQLKAHDAWEEIGSYVITGNYRYSYFKKHRDFYENVVKKEILNRFEKPQPVILYAPTWMDLEESTSFFSAYEDVLGNLPDEYNLIVKLHPRLELDDVVQYYHIMGKYEERGNILFLKDSPLVFPVLAHADIYIGDMSSVGYDFLAFNKPMFFLNMQNRDAHNDRGLYLFRCGKEIKVNELPQLYKIIERSLSTDDFSPQRKEVWNYTFGPEREFDAIRADIIAAC